MDARRTICSAAALVFGAALTMLPACGGDDGDGNGVTPPPPDPDPGAVSGSIVDDTGAGVQGAAVALERTGATTRNATTDASGSFLFSDVEPGSWQVRVTPPSGFTLGAGQANPVSVTVASNQTATVTLVLDRELPAEAGRVEGAIRLGSQGIQGVVVDLASDAGPVASRTTEADGVYAFEDLDPGEYSVSVTLPAAFQLAGGEDATKTATVTLGQTTVIDYAVELAAASPVVEIELMTSPNRFVGPSGGSTEVVSRGTTVRWVNQTSIFHTVTPDGHEAWQRAETSSPGLVLEVLLLNPGTFDYFCEPHLGEGMTGSIVVQ